MCLLLAKYPPTSWQRFWPSTKDFALTCHTILTILLSSRFFSFTMYRTNQTKDELHVELWGFLRFQHRTPVSPELAHFSDHLQSSIAYISRHPQPNWPLQELHCKVVAPLWIQSGMYPNGKLYALKFELSQWIPSMIWQHICKKTWDLRPSFFRIRFSRLY